MGSRERTMRHAWMQSLAVTVCSMTINAVAFAEETRPPVLATRLRCEYQVDPVGIGVRQPRLSWQLTAEGPGVVDRPGLGRRPDGSAARADAAHDVRGRGPGAGGPRLRHQPGIVRGRA